jgi:protein-tyrosine-phosphatase
MSDPWSQFPDAPAADPWAAFPDAQASGGTDTPPLARAPELMGQPEERGLGRSLMLGAQAVGRGVAETAAMLPNLAGAALNTPLMAADMVADKAFGARVPFRFNQNYGEGIANAAGTALDAVGVPTYEPENWQERSLYNVGNYGTQGLLGGYGLAKAGDAAGATSRSVFGDRFVRPYVQGDPARVIAGDAVGGAGAGGLLTASQEAPKEIRDAGGGTIGPLLDYLAMTMGGIGANATFDMATGAPPAVVRSIRGRMIDPDMPLDPETGIAFTRGQTERAARQFQGGASNPTRAAESIGENTAYYRNEGLPVPTSGLMSDDIGLIGRENAARTRLGSRSLVGEDGPPGNRPQYNFVERDQALKEQSLAQVRSLSPTGSDPEAFPQGVRDVLDDRLAQRAGVARNAESAVAAKDAEAVAAQRDLEAQAAAFQAKRAGVDDASREIDKVYRDARGNIIEQNKQNFDPQRIDPTGETQLDTTPLSKVATDLRQKAAGLPDEVRDLLFPNKMLADIEGLSPIIKNETTTSPLVDASGDPIRRTEEVNVGGPGKVSYEKLNQIRLAIATSQAQEQLAKRYGVSDSLKALKDEIDRSVERMAADGSVAGNRTQAALDYSRETVAPNLRRGVGGELDKIIKRDDTETRLPPGETAGRFLTSKEGAEDLLRIARTANSEATAVSAAKRWLFGQMAENGIASNGKLSPDGLVEWRETGGNAKLLDTVPGLRKEFDDLLLQSRNKVALSEETTAALKKAQADLKGAEGKLRDQERFNRTDPLGKMAGSDAARAVPMALRDSREMRKVVDTIGFNPEARAGLKNAVSAHLVKEVKTGTSTIKANPGEAFDKYRPALAEVFDPEEMNRLQRAQKLVEPLAKRYQGATVGSQTAERAEGLLARGFLLPFEVVAKIRYGMLKGGGITSNTKKVLQQIGSSDQSVVQRIQDLAFFDPESAQHLLTMSAAKNNSPTYNSALAKLIKRNELLISLSEDDESEARPRNEITVTPRPQ